MPRRHRGVVGNKPYNVAAHAAKGRDGIACPVSLSFEKVTVITQLLDQNADIERRIEARGGVECLLEQNIDIDRLTVDRVRCLSVGCEGRI